jgi:hypothetical protein
LIYLSLKTIEIIIKGWIALHIEWQRISKGTNSIFIWKKSVTEGKINERTQS